MGGEGKGEGVELQGTGRARAGDEVMANVRGAFVLATSRIGGMGYPNKTLKQKTHMRLSGLVPPIALGVLQS